MTKKHTHAVRAVAVALGAGAMLAVAACSGYTSDGSSSSAASSAAAAPAAAPSSAASASMAMATGSTIHIKGMTFEQITVAPGTMITVMNMDSMTHTITGDGFDTGKIAPGKSAMMEAPKKPGMYPIHCTTHPEMTGTLMVN